MKESKFRKKANPADENKKLEWDNFKYKIKSRYNLILIDENEMG